MKNVVAKLLGVKYPKVGLSHSMGGNKMMDLTDNKLIKSTIANLLFKQAYDYVLVRYDGKMYICEKFETGYTRTTIIYHPLQALVKF